MVEPSTVNINNFYNQIIKVCDEIRSSIEINYDFSVTIGIGEHKQSIIDAHLSYKEALNALKIGKIIHKKNKIMFYKDLGVYRRLEAIYNTSQAKEFCKLSIGKLIRYDEKRGTELFKTLVCIKECDWNLKNAAQKMYIHYNTIKYRYKKIEQILNIDLENSEERFIISISIKLINMSS